MRQLLRDEMNRFSLETRGPMTIKETISIQVGEEKERINMFLKPLVIDRSARSEKIIGITGIALLQDNSSVLPVPMHIRFGKGVHVEIYYSSYTIEGDDDLTMLRSAYRDYERFRHLMGIGNQQ